VDPVLGEQAATGHGAIGRRSPTGAQPHGQHGGAAAHAHLLTGLAGLLGRGALLRHGRHGQAALLAQRQQVLELLLSMEPPQQLPLMDCKLLLQVAQALLPREVLEPLMLRPRV
jgi:hypothetical protein